MNSDVINELLVFLLRPSTFVGAFFVTTRFSHTYNFGSVCVCGKQNDKNNVQVEETPTYRKRGDWESLLAKGTRLGT